MGLLKNIVRRVLASTPYEMRRRVIPTPVPTLEIVALALAYYRQLKPDAVFVQVGACDGVSGLGKPDPVHHLVKSGRMRCVLVEPMESSYRLLEAAYAGCAHVRTCQAAIGHSDGTATMYKIRDIPHPRLHASAVQWASFNRQHLLAHGATEEDIAAVEVPQFTLATLLAKFDLPAIDFLQVDVEGFDAEVVRMALALRVPPDCINFEFAHLDAPTRTALYRELTAAGYRWVHDEVNTLAIHERLAAQWLPPGAVV